MKPKNKWIALLLNLVVCPGAGHLYLKRKKMGIGIMAFVGGIVIYVVISFQMQVLARLKVSTNPELLTGQTSNLLQSAWEVHSATNSILLILALIVWVYSAVDIFIRK